MGCLTKKRSEKTQYFLNFKTMGQGDIDWNAPFLVLGIGLVN